MRLTNLVTALSIVTFVFTTMTGGAFAQGSIYFDSVMSNGGDQVSQSTADMVTSRIAATVGAKHNTGGRNAQFAVEIEFISTYLQTIANPAPQTILSSTLMLRMVDRYDKRVYSTTSIDIKGVGTGEHRAYINALQKINANNKNILEFVDSGKAAIEKRYNNEYESILGRARVAYKTKEYAKALFLTTSIPTWCKGYNKAVELTLTIYGVYRDELAQQNLLQAKSAWAVDATERGAKRAAEYIAEIPSDASCYSEAVELVAEIKAKIHSDFEFEVHKKYEDAIELRHKSIEAAQLIGIAYGENQTSDTTNIIH